MKKDIKSIHDNIRKIRELKGFTQEYLANELDISIRAYSKIETGETQLTLSRLFKICEILNVSPEEVLGFDSSLIFNNNFNSEKGKNIAYNNTEIHHIQQLYERLLTEKDEIIALLKEKISKYQAVE